MFYRFVVVALTVAVLVSLPMAGTSQDLPCWRLLGEDNKYPGTAANDETTHYTDYNMSKTDTTTYSSKDLEATKTMWWYADCPAQCDLTFPGNEDWTVRIDHEQRNGWIWTADIYNVASDGAATCFASGNNAASNTESGVTTVTCHQETPQTFHTADGDRLALRIKHNDNTQRVETYFYREDKGTLSNLTCPVSDPAYPVPELSTLVLFSTGLLTLAGYRWLLKLWRRV